ncbi:hypothetical protein KFE25_007503 [Diacronema lutheri]|uniref:peptidylprolyl isomerase n=1 Tax=Diacronema lutheri TaxID=2081491 RepID=A0A8J5Y0G5_DIALT|nr:hypothetical protein KFE25_007503 [Diacronema lutheri]
MPALALQQQASMAESASGTRALLSALSASGDAGGLRRLLCERRSDPLLAACLAEPEHARSVLPLHEAADGGHSLCVLLLLLEHIAAGLSVDPPTAVQATPLHLAARAGDALSVRALLFAKADPHARTRKGRLAAELASERKHAHVLDELLAHPPPPPTPPRPSAAALCAGPRNACALCGASLADGDASLGIGPQMCARDASMLHAACRAYAARRAERTPGRPRVWLDFTVDEQALGRVEAELFADVVPRTAENFRALCTGELGPSAQFGRVPLHYAGCAVHRIVPGFVVQSGDFTLGNGRGGVSIYGGKFEDESFAGLAGDHFGLGALSMANSGPNTNGSQFFITLGRLPHLNGKHVVFGRVLRGFCVLKQLELLGSASGTPAKRVVIAACGEARDESSAESG